MTMILEEKPEMIIGIPLDKTVIKNTLYFTEVMGNVVNKLVNGESIKDIGVADVSYMEKNPLRPCLVTTG